jgi:hypothetical protein
MLITNPIRLKEDVKTWDNKFKGTGEGIKEDVPQYENLKS